MSDDSRERAFRDLDRRIEERQPRFVEELTDLAAIPSETAQAEPLADAARWVADRLRAAGATVGSLVDGESPELLYGDFGSGPRTLLCVQHYDVQPADPLAEWLTPPFEPTVRDGRLFARGVVDNKGHLLARIHLIELYRESFGELPCPVRFLVEGEEESGSPHLEALLAKRPDLSAVSGALNEGGQVGPDDRPILSCGVRGMLYVELRVRTLAQDAHSMFASLLPNAAARLVGALATIRHEDGTVDFPGFLDRARIPTAADIAHLRALPFDEASFKAQHGTVAFVSGLTGFDAQVAQLFAPTCNIDGIQAGWMGQGIKTVTPAAASARLDLRLVPDQDPDAVATHLRAHFSAQGYPDVEVFVHSAERAYWTPIDDPIVRAAERATAAVHGRPSLRLISGPGTAPMYPICAPHGVPFVALGLTHADARLHAPNENLRLDLVAPLMRATARFIAEFAA